MEKLNNILNREDYIKSVDEGRIGDFLRRGVQKIKKAFGMYVAKIKNFITAFTSDGEPLPVTMPQAIGDNFKDNGTISFYGTNAMDSEIKKMGGTGCNTDAPLKREGDYKDFFPVGDPMRFKKWLDNDFPQTDYYKNVEKLGEILSGVNESIEVFDVSELDEEFDMSRRVPYKNGEYGGGETTGAELSGQMTTEQFKAELTRRVKATCGGPRLKTKPEQLKGYPTLLVFGAQGIGKSTIPNKVIEAYNKNKTNPEDMISLITISCGDIQPGDLLMPGLPTKKDVLKWIDKNDGSMAAAAMKSMTAEKWKEFKKEMENNPQYTANSAPQPWLPCYRVEGGVKDYFNDAAANGYYTTVQKDVYDEESGMTFTVEENVKTKGGGIVLFDELLLTKPAVLDSLMNFLLTKELNGYRLGSKWVIIACSNRPCDDEKCAKNWESWGSPKKGRWQHIINLEPDPDDWRDNFARKIGFDETLLKFIFDPSSMVDGEYTRWHRVLDAEGTKHDSHKEVSPRKWETVHYDLLRFAEENPERFKDGFSITKMSIDEIEEVLKFALDTDFLSELKTWLNENCGNFDLDKIIENPVRTAMPMGADIDEVKVINELRKKMEERWGGEKPSAKPTDEELSNIMIWLGINYKDKFNIIYNFFQQFKYIVTKYGFWDFHKLGLMFMAAFPEEDYMDVVNHEKLREALCDEKHGNGRTEFFLENADEFLDTVKGFAKEYFPWRLQDNELVPVLNFTPEPEEEEKEGEE